MLIKDSISYINSLPEFFPRALCLENFKNSTWKIVYFGGLHLVMYILYFLKYVEIFPSPTGAKDNSANCTLHIAQC